MGITHGWTTAEADNPAYDVSADELNTHTVDNGSFVAAKLSATATDKVFGRSTAGAGAGEEIALTAAGRALIDDADAAAQRTTLGIAAAITGTKLDDLTAPDDNTDLNATTSAHGLMPKGTGSTTTFFRSDMTQATPAGGSVTEAHADSTADVTLTADTIADATGASVSLAAGTWIIWAQATFSATTATFDYCLVNITDGANAVVGEARGNVNSNSPVCYSPLVVVTPGSTTTYKLRGQSGRTGNKILRYGQGTNIGTRIVALKVA